MWVHPRQVSNNAELVHDVADVSIGHAVDAAAIAVDAAQVALENQAGHRIENTQPPGAIAVPVVFRLPQVDVTAVVSTGAEVCHRRDKFDIFDQCLSQLETPCARGGQHRDAARIRELVLRAEECLSRGNRDEAMRLLSLINDKANAIEDIMRKAHDGTFRD